MGLITLTMPRAVFIIRPLTSPEINNTGLYPGSELSSETQAQPSVTGHRALRAEAKLQIWHRVGFRAEIMEIAATEAEARHHLLDSVIDSFNLRTQSQSGVITGVD